MWHNGRVSAEQTTQPRRGGTEKRRCPLGSRRRRQISWEKIPVVFILKRKQKWKSRLTHPDKHTDYKKYSGVTRLVQSGLFLFCSSYIQYIKAEEEEKTHWDPQDKPPLSGGKMKGRSRLLCRRLCCAQIILSVCLCWTVYSTPPPPLLPPILLAPPPGLLYKNAALWAYTHFLQFGRRVLCSGT